MDAGCGCHCIKCKGTNLKTDRVGEPEEDGYYDMHHTCADCSAHFDHLEGVTFIECQACGFPGDDGRRDGVGHAGAATAAGPSHAS